MGHRAPSLWHSFQRGNISLGKSDFGTQPYIIITPFSQEWCTFWEHDCFLLRSPVSTLAIYQQPVQLEGNRPTRITDARRTSGWEGEAI